ncbi:CDP-glycerol glycerophosphotransferase family protein [Blastococcus brunescens]|uniref:CDP-glycerol glycerophosphotransferase family protein n=1 Tax=Blastococcus brunescens TaxID=1564165 RepID=A0ABZ1B4Q0_9ACTN|nr:CDP-glycerol glycerophosphotransferase family protein [Blastococcus sp. BMG 8361]WRL64354.1 CDP-glycerol glycerophosphotransferase family protein [Blastococcus sp. BMG 8361]
MLNRSGAPIEVVDKQSLRGVLKASRAGMLLVTHGLYGSPDLTARKLVVNMWHGFGPKATRASTSLRKPVVASAMTCNSPVWAAAATRELGSPDTKLIRTGNPRQLACRTAPDPSVFDRLGLRPRSYVLWMPTFRSSTSAAGRSWRDAPTLTGRSPDGEFPDATQTLARLARDAGVEVVVKPHPSDADRFERSGLRVLTTDEIFSSGMSLYQFIGASAAMISDYSSVWVEYLDLDRPLLLYCPDISEYLTGRGLNEPYMTDVARELITDEPAVVADFLERVRAGGDWRPDARAVTRTALGLDGLALDKAAVTDALLQELADFERSRGRGRGRTRGAPTGAVPR